METGEGATSTGFAPRASDCLFTVQELFVQPGREDDFVRRFEELDVLALAAEAASGALSSAVLAQDGQRFVVATSWASPDGIDAWVASPARERVRAELEPLYAQEPRVSRYTIRSRFAARPAADGGT